MAWIRKSFSDDSKWDGPFPNKAGEFCGNEDRKHIEVSKDGTTIVKTRHQYFIYKGDQDEMQTSENANKRIGLPSNCRAGTSKEMAVKGYVGTYLIADVSIALNEYLEIDTDALQEEVVSGMRPPNKPFLPGVPMRE